MGGIADVAVGAGRYRAAVGDFQRPRAGAPDRKPGAVDPRRAGAVNGHRARATGVGDATVAIGDRAAVGDRQRAAATVADIEIASMANSATGMVHIEPAASTVTVPRATVGRVADDGVVAGDGDAVGDLQGRVALVPEVQAAAAGPGRAGRHRQTATAPKTTGGMAHIAGTAGGRMPLVTVSVALPAYPRYRLPLLAQVNPPHQERLPCPNHRRCRPRSRHRCGPYRRW